MTNQRDPNKVSIGAYITREEKEKLWPGRSRAGVP